ncbi:MAG: methionine--tRNA ligase [Coxiella sp. RIFCSPHIGHO2_12_FULL_44_14]|nr:MAG: methionine--tRNA ligase [Coxiella sp. RIFCSPHIGHO2_12_FULL_44_14]
MTSPTIQRRLLVTAALPYANGPIHLGHLVEHIQADIWVRFQRLQGHSCLFLCGDDAHGTPIMASAQKQGITPEELIERMHIEHIRDLADFYIDFDHFYTTHSPENRRLSEYVYHHLNRKGDIFTQEISQAFDPIQHVFLPDRFIRGKCPRCGAQDQYGDVCEVCGATYNVTELIHPISVLSGATPIEKTSLHYFFALGHYTESLKTWIHSGRLQPQVTHKLEEWFQEGLKPWDISRDAPYFGFEIPDAPQKYFYVWLDASIGYMSIFEHFITQRPELNFDEYWGKDSSTELYHFIGKDIIYFHALFWPAMLQGAKFRTPTGIHVHGYLTINGKKMSKSRGIFITARDYLQQLNPEYLRYYFAAKLNAHIEDIDLNLEDFAQRINADLVGKYVNLASRCAPFITREFQGQLGETLAEPGLFDEFVHAGESIAKDYATLEYNKALRHIMALADRANQYIDQQAPWVLAKQAGQEKQVQAIATVGLNLFKILTTYLKPVLPHTAQKVEQFLNVTPLSWLNRAEPLLQHTIQPFQPLLQRITKEAIETLTQIISHE